MTEARDALGRSGSSIGYSMDRYIVTIRYGGRRIGLYRVMQVGEVGMLLNHGGISFPVGTQLDVEDVHSVAPDSDSPCRPATVVGNTRRGLKLAWRRAETGGAR